MSKDGPIYEKFKVTRTDGRHKLGGKHVGCEYFVLDITHDPFALPSLWAYAIACVSTHPELSGSLRSICIRNGFPPKGEGT